MDDLKYQFLLATVGQSGANALRKSLDARPELADAILPRVVWSWTKLAALHPFEGQIPGVSKTFLQFKKSEAGYDGMITIGDDLYRFSDASLAHVASVVAVGIGYGHERLDRSVKDVDLVKLGKSIDLLVKTNVLAEVLKTQKEDEEDDELEKMDLPGQAAAPRAPTEPEKPWAPQKQGVEPKPPQPKPAGVKAPPKPTVTPHIPKLNLSEERMSVECEVCGSTQFRKGEFVGCYCFRDLADDVKLTKTEGGVQLSFGKKWDTESLQTLMEAVGLGE